MNNQELTKTLFTEMTLKRDQSRCVICGSHTEKVYHIIDQHLWEKNGYFLENGVCLCNNHSEEAEKTHLSPDDLRKTAGITKILLPDHLSPEERYDRYGNIILEDGRRLKGDLFFEDFVQKNLLAGGILSLFNPMVKYPRTYHLPWSEGVTDDDKILKNLDHFKNKRIIVTEKMDGENTTLYRETLHARSLDGRSHPSRNWIKNFHRNFSHNIPQDWRVCGENLYAKHSIFYKSLRSYFMGFSVWTDKNICLSWDETIEWFELFEITPVPVLYDGLYDEDYLKKLWETIESPEIEGYVIRLATEIPYKDFKTSFGKFVRKNHVQTDKHWMTQNLEKNLLQK